MNNIKHNIFFSFIAATLVCGLVFTAFGPGAQAEEGFAEAQKSEIQTIVKQYLMENPEVLVESLEAYRVKEEREQEEQSAAKVTESLSYLTRSDAPSAGNADGSITIVEFFDYNCGYCKRALPDIQKVLNEEKDVRFIFQEMPILGPTSFTAAQWALAAHKQGKYFEYHTALMDHRGAKNESELTKIADKLGLDTKKMKQDANSEDVKSMLNKSMQTARDIGIQGTPAFIVNGELVRGYMGPDGMKAAIENARGKKEG